MFAKLDTVRLAPIIGGTGWVTMGWDFTQIGAGAVLGISALSKRKPVTASLEYRPTYGIINVPEGDELDLVGFGAHLQYVFPVKSLK